MRGSTATVTGMMGLILLVLLAPALADANLPQADIGNVTGQLQKHADERGVAISHVSFEIESEKCTANASISEPLVLAGVPVGAPEVSMTLSAHAGSCREAGALLEEGIASVASAKAGDGLPD